MRALVTGGAGFIGRWVVKELLAGGQEVTVLDNFSGGCEENIREFFTSPGFCAVKGDIREPAVLASVFEDHDVCYHLAASIIVQDSIDKPWETFANDVEGTFNVLEECRKHKTKMVFMSTCMVYDRARDALGISEGHPVKPASPYAGCKIAGENLVLSYYHAYGLPVVVLRPFNTYGPFQKTTGEGGVIAIFVARALAGQTLNIYGDGTQTRDFLYVEDCARFVVAAGNSVKTNGEILNAGTGQDISINQLGALIAGDPSRLNHISHIHQQSEIPKLLCDCRKAKSLLGWQPNVELDKGIRLTAEWLILQRNIKIGVDRLNYLCYNSPGGSVASGKKRYGR